MEQTGRHERTRTGKEFLQSSTFALSRGPVIPPRALVVAVRAPHATLPLVTENHPDIAEHRQDDPGRRRLTVRTSAIPDRPLTRRPHPRIALGVCTTAVACRPPARSCSRSGSGSRGDFGLRARAFARLRPSGPTRSDRRCPNPEPAFPARPGRSPGGTGMPQSTAMQERQEQVTRVLLVPSDAQLCSDATRTAARVRLPLGGSDRTP